MPATHVRLLPVRPIYISLTAMIMGTQMFLAGFLGELISRSDSKRNQYKIEAEI